MICVLPQIIPAIFLNDVYIFNQNSNHIHQLLAFLSHHINQAHRKFEKKHTKKLLKVKKFIWKSQQPRWSISLSFQNTFNLAGSSFTFPFIHSNQHLDQTNSTKQMSFSHIHFVLAIFFYPIESFLLSFHVKEKKIVARKSNSIRRQIYINSTI